MPVYFECQRCTACCRWPGDVRLAEGEVMAIAGFLEMPPREFVERYTRLRADRLGLTLVENADGSCVFLHGQNCAIQSVKPQQCRDFPNRWRFPGFDKTCRAVAVDVDEAEYARRVMASTGQSPVEGMGMEIRDARS